MLRLRTCAVGLLGSVPVGRCISYDSSELERERDLRETVSKKYRIPPSSLPQITYGHHSNQGIAGSMAQRAAADASNSSHRTGPNVNWVMLLTGCALVFYSGKLMFNRVGGNVTDIEIPLWVSSIEGQAKHLLFTVQFDDVTREGLSQQFQAVRAAYPLADFFEWVRSQRPEFGSGQRYNYHSAMSSLTSILSQGNRQQLAQFARVLQQSMRSSETNSMSRIDNLMDSMQSNGLVFGFPAGAGSEQRVQFLPNYGTSAQFAGSLGSVETSINSALEAPSGGLHGSTPFPDQGKN